MTDKTCGEVDLTRIWITMTKYEKEGDIARKRFYDLRIMQNGCVLVSY